MAFLHRFETAEMKMKKFEHTGSSESAKWIKEYNR